MNVGLTFTGKTGDALLNAVKNFKVEDQDDTKKLEEAYYQMQGLVYDNLQVQPSGTTGRNWLA